MLTPALRSKVHSLWDSFWSAGLTNPLVAIEQITYLLFLQQLEARDRKRVANGKASIYSGPNDEFRWSHFRQMPPGELPIHLRDKVFPWLRELPARLATAAGGGKDPVAEAARRLEDASFVLDPNKSQTLARAINLIDELFAQHETRTANKDLMGDVFEHLLDEIQSSGTNGQFRTPRHIIRFMVELLNPKPGCRVLDPACGSGGFLYNTLLHWKRLATDPASVVLEWDGTPHRCDGGDARIEDLVSDESVVGFDNDRTMVRIAWMNLILHDLDFPQVEQRDSLSKNLNAEQSGTYDYVLANPPFTGNVDEQDLSDNRKRFPGAEKGRSVITTKSELLFVWLILDLLKVGGRAAVIVPDGVLFGSTGAHRALRRQLLFDNTVEAVISLPAGVFLPYAGVKTSIVVFQRAETEDRDERCKPGDEPRTREVWFYEVEEEARTLDQKRNPRHAGPNDLWDALARFPTKEVSGAYYQPTYLRERWRDVDKKLIELFPGNRMVTGQPGAQLRIQELFPELPASVDDAITSVRDDVTALMTGLLRGVVNETRALAHKEPGKPPMELFEKLRRPLWPKLNTLSRESLDREYGQYGHQLLKETFDAAVEAARAELLGDKPARVKAASSKVDDTDARCQRMIEACARLDGFEVWTRSAEAPANATGKPGPASDAPKAQVRCWRVPVRTWAPRDAWPKATPEGVAAAKPTHKKGAVRADYLAHCKKVGVFGDDAVVLEAYRDLLDPGCLEANDLNLSAGRYRPFSFDAGTHSSPADLVRELDGIHGQIRDKLARLLVMLEEAK